MAVEIEVRGNVAKLLEDINNINKAFEVNEKTLTRLNNTIQNLEKSVDRSFDETQVQRFRAQYEELIKAAGEVSTEIKGLVKLREFTETVKGVTTELKKSVTQAKNLSNNMLKASIAAAELENDVTKATRLYTLLNKNVDFTLQDQRKMVRTASQFNIQVNETNNITKNINRNLRVSTRHLKENVGLSRKWLDVLRKIRAAFTFLFAGHLVIQFVRDIGIATDELQSMRNLLRASGVEDLTAGMREAAQLARDTRAEITVVSKLYARLQRISNSIGATQKEVADVTRAISQGLQVAGANAQETSSAIIQLSQGLSSGRLHGDELRSILENAPILAEKLARQLGVNVGQLREMGAQGKLINTEIFDALVRIAGELNQEFSKLPPTIGQSWTIFSNGAKAAKGHLGEILVELTKVDVALRAMGDLFLDLSNKRKFEGIRDALESLPKTVKILDLGIRRAGPNVDKMTEKLESTLSLMRGNTDFGNAEQVKFVTTQLDNMITQLSIQSKISEEGLARLKEEVELYKQRYAEAAKGTAEQNKLEQSKKSTLRIENTLSKARLIGTKALTEQEKLEKAITTAKKEYHRLVEAGKTGSEELEKIWNDIVKAEKEANKRLEEKNKKTDKGTKNLEKRREALLQQIRLENISLSLKDKDLTIENRKALILEKQNLLIKKLVDKMKELGISSDFINKTVDERNALTQKNIRDADELFVKQLNAKTTLLSMDRRGLATDEQKKVLQEQRQLDIKKEIDSLSETQRANTQIVDAIKAYHKEKNKLADEERKQKEINGTLKETTGMFKNLSQAVLAFSNDNHKAFEAFKILAIAEATVSTYAAANNALRTTVLPPPFPQINAAAIIALGLANVGKINAMTPPQRRAGGPVSAGHMYQVGEGNVPELLHSGGKQYLIAGDDGNITPNAGMGGTTVYENLVINTSVGFGLNSYATADSVSEATLMALSQGQKDNFGRSSYGGGRRV